MSKQVLSVDWKKIWDAFDIWCENKSNTTKCATCQHTDYDEPEWDEQQAKIKLLVDVQVRKIVKKKS